MKSPARFLAPVAGVVACLAMLPASASAQASDAASAAPVASTPVSLTVRLDAPAKPISPDLFGIFFEDLSWAADGGLYAELIQNRSFEYDMTERREWNYLTCWDCTNRGGSGGVVPDAAFPVHPNNPHYAVFEVGKAGDVELSNGGFDGIVLRAGDKYDLSFFARRLYTGGRWDGDKSDAPLPVIARLVAKDGTVLAETSFEIGKEEWVRYSATLTPTASVDDARFVLVAHDRGGFGLDDVSLVPQKTFHNHPNGLRPDLAQVIADLHPRFVRFPGGCLVHGSGLPNMYRWKDTIGPIEQRRQQGNLWGYHQTVGLGYFEYFQFCEDIGAEPLPVVPAAVSCQNSGHQGGTGQQCLPLDDLPGYIQDLLDLIEWANGPATSKWGAKRAAAGHPAPFGLKYLGVGNEDHITPGFRERFAAIHAALTAAHPEITIIGTVGPFPDGQDYDDGWKIANELHVSIVDEHYYKSPQWFWDNLQRYDTYDRSHSKVYAGEYAAHDDRRRNTLRSAIAEAAYLTSLERNGDVVHMASYAPLLARRGHTNWSPDMIYFTGIAVSPSLNYEVQRLFMHNSGDAYVTTSLSGTGGAADHLAASTVHDAASGDLIVKIVNGEASPRVFDVVLSGAKALPANAALTVFAGPDANVTNEDGQPPAVPVVTSNLAVSSHFAYEAPANSLTILRIPVH